MIDELASQEPKIENSGSVEPTTHGGQNDFSAVGMSNWIPPEVSRLEAIISDYKVESMIAKGGMGAVYKVTQEDLNRVCALKILPLEISREPGFEERFILEARAMASLNHPNIMTIYDFGRTSEGHIFYVMEFVDGLDLFQLISKERVEEEKAVKLMMQVCDALDFAHESGFVHRDVKPANVMIDQLGRVKVTDFGLAKLLSNDGLSGVTLVGQAIGTPEYMAPEQSMGEVVDHRADIYALGVVLYELLTGGLPRGIFAPPSKKIAVDKKYDEVIIQAMQQDPEQRFQRVSDMKALIMEAHEATVYGYQPKGRSKKKSKVASSVFQTGDDQRNTFLGSGGVVNFLLGFSALAFIGAGGFWYMQDLKLKEAVGGSALVNGKDISENNPTRGSENEGNINGNGFSAEDKLVANELQSLELDVKGVRNEIERQGKLAAEESSDMLKAEQARLNEAVELAKRASEKREQLFEMAQNSQLAAQLSNDGQSFKDTFAKEVDMKLLELDGTEGNVQAQFLLGKIYELGKGVEVNQEQADKWYKVASNQGHEGAQQSYREKYFQKGLKYYNGINVKKDFDKALANFQLAAERDNTVAMNLLGWMYDAGEGVEVNKMQSTRWYLKAAKLGYASAQFNIAECYNVGIGVEKNFEKAMGWYLKAAEQGNKQATLFVSDFYRKGLEAGKNPKETAMWIKQGAENGDAAAQCEIGKLYVTGRGVERDPKLAVKWLRKSAEQGYDRGQHNLGVCYLNGLGVIKSNDQALLWFQKAADQGNPRAQRDLAIMYAKGVGVKKDYKKVLDLYKSAAGNGLVEAEYNIGVLYLRGLGVSKSPKTAFKWFSKAAKQGHILAQYNLGVCYYNGIGVKRNSKKSKIWLKKAAAAGNEEAKKTLKKLK